jgi:hypothetical protein
MLAFLMFDYTRNLRVCFQYVPRYSVCILVPPIVLIAADVLVYQRRQMKAVFRMALLIQYNYLTA